jgi:NADP-dependent 3-hydroxy acid dehydrogenase YdfG
MSTDTDTGRVAVITGASSAIGEASAQAVAAAQCVERELGRTDVLINNAGVMLLAPFTSDQRAEQRQMVEVNLLGAITATEVFLDQLRDGGGDLVNISSVAGRTARAGTAVYAPRTGVSTASRKPCARSFNPTCA